MIVIIALTFGFDERFAIRALMRRGIRGAVRIAVLVPEEGEQERLERALSVLNDFVTQYVTERGIERLAVPVEDFLGSVLMLARTFRSWTERPVVLNLSGGMRLLVAEALSAALLSRVPMTVEIESEDGKVLAEFSTTVLTLPETDEVDRQIIESLGYGAMTLGLLSERLGLSKPTVWRRLRRLAEAGLLELSKGRKREAVASLTKSGKFYRELVCWRELTRMR